MKGCSPTEQVYQSVKCHILPAVHDAGTKVAAIVIPKGDTLPFTGVDLALLLIAGIVLVIAGFSLRRITRKA